MKCLIFIASLVLAISHICIAEQNKEFRERAEIYSSNVQISIYFSLVAI